MKIKNHVSKITFLLSIVLLMAGVPFLPGAAVTVQAAQLNLTFSSTDGSNCSNISDGYFYYGDIDGSTEAFDAGTEITITSDEPIDAIYIEWYYIPDPWTLRIGDQEYPCGQKGYIQEYIKIPEEQKGATSATIVLGESKERLIDVYAFSEGTLPDFVHVWEDPYEEADILLVSTHADDEVLFFGGIVPTYTNQPDVRVQVAYFSNFFLSEPYRCQELLNGLWTMGVTHYPQMGEFYDNYSESYEEAQGQFDYDESLAYMVRTLRRFKPQVVIGQDINNGEYGHGGHIWCARALADALEVSSDESVDPDSARTYGTWDVPKTYFHLYPENQLELDARVPLARFGGKTALEVAELAYQQHTSQSSWMWFEVRDGKEEDADEFGDRLNCTKFGLYRTTVGLDTGKNDILEHITTYDQQEAIRQEEERAREAAALAAQEAETDASDPANAEAVSPDPSGTQEQHGSSARSGISPWIIVLIIVLILVLALIVLFLYQRAQQRKRRRRRNNSVRRRR